MEKLAIFVEGQTEEVFVTELLLQIAPRNAVHIDRVSAFGGGAAGSRTFHEVEATSRPDPTKRFYVIVYNSATDSRVLSDIRDHYENLCSQQFKMIIGLRDVKPQTHADIPAIRANFDSLVKHRPVHPLLVLQIMEIEAWFIAESTHFAKIDTKLTPAVVAGQLGYDPETFDIEQCLDPASDLRGVYMLVHKGYNKSRQHAERTVKILNYEAIYLSLGTRFSDFANLLSYLNDFFK
jgi:hypothetical protein